MCFCTIAYIRALCNERKHVVKFIFDPIVDHIHIQRHTPRIPKSVIVLVCCSLTITKGQTEIIWERVFDMTSISLHSNTDRQLCRCVYLIYDALSSSRYHTSVIEGISLGNGMRYNSLDNSNDDNVTGCSLVYTQLISFPCGIFRNVRVR